jgi:hypothetical protein
MSITCFTLVGLWWTVVERHPDWKTDRSRRRLAGGVYLSFLLPGLMSTFAQVDSGNPLVWRTSFSIAAVVGLVTSLRLVSVDRSGYHGPFRRFRWLVALFYGLILLLSLVPAVAQLVGVTPLQAASVALILLVVMGHGLTWEFMMEPDATGTDAPTADGATGTHAGREDF